MSMHYLDAAGSEGAFLGSAAAVTARVVEVRPVRRARVLRPACLRLHAARHAAASARCLLSPAVCVGPLLSARTSHTN